MEIWLADPLFGGAVQSGRHLIELSAAFGLTAIIGLERTIQGKVAGLRTQTIVGTSSALREILHVCGQRNWQLTELEADDGNIDRDQVAVAMTLSGNKISNATRVLSEIDGVSAAPNAEDEPD